MSESLVNVRQVVVILISLGCVAGAVLFVRKRLAGLLQRDAESIVAVSAAVIAVYGLILGLTLAAAWERYQRADDGLTTELNEMFILSRMAYNWKGYGGEELQESIIDYGRAVGEHELTGQSAEEADGDIGRLKLQDIYLQLTAITAGPKGSLGVTDPAWVTLASLDSARGARLTLTRIALPKQFWGVLYLGGLLSLMALVLIHPSSRTLHLTISVCSAALIVLALILLRDLDAPFQGSSTVDFASFNHGVEVLEKSLATMP